MPDLCPYPDLHCNVIQVITFCDFSLFTSLITKMQTSLQNESLLLISTGGRSGCNILKGEKKTLKRAAHSINSALNVVSPKKPIWVVALKWNS